MSQEDKPHEPKPLISSDNLRRYNEAVQRQAACKSLLDRLNHLIDHPLWREGGVKETNRLTGQRKKVEQFQAKAQSDLNMILDEILAAIPE